MTVEEPENRFEFVGRVTSRAVALARGAEPVVQTIVGENVVSTAIREIHLWDEADARTERA